MTWMKRIAIVWLAPIVAMCVIDLGAEYLVPGFHVVINDAEARVGRPLTPVSVAGTARRNAASLTENKTPVAPPGTN